MKYYKVKPSYEGMATKDGRSLIANELFTVKEFEKLKVPASVASIVEVSKKNVYISFGARFEVGTDHSTVF